MEYNSTKQFNSNALAGPYLDIAHRIILRPQTLSEPRDRSKINSYNSGFNANWSQCNAVNVETLRN